MTYKCNVLFVPGHRAPVVRGNHGRFSPPPPFLRRVCAHTAARVHAYTRTQRQYAWTYPGPGTEAASAFLLYYV